jgi:hypothetical protein
MVTRQRRGLVPLASPPIKSTLIRRAIMRDIANGVFLGLMAFTLPLAIYVMTTGGL